MSDSLLPFERALGPGEFVLYTGRLRSGKTLAAVRLATLLAARLSFRLAANIPVTGGILLHTLEDLLDLRDAVVVWDEIQASLDSREYASQVSRLLTRELILFGKRGIVLLGTTPAFAMVDTRLRRLTYHVHRTVRRLSWAGQTWATYDYYRHPAGDDVLRYVTSYALCHSRWYGTYDTLYGRDAHHDLVLVSRAPAPPRR